MSNYYIYRITDLYLNKHYYGSRKPKSNRLPEDDLGVHYFSSSRDSEFINEQHANPARFKYKVIHRNLSALDANRLECKYHEKFDVARNPSFYNKCRQTSSKWMCTKDTGILISKAMQNGAAKRVSETHKRLHKLGILSKSGENNPRHGDHRTYIEIYGEERAKLLKDKQSEFRCGSGNSRANTWKFTSPIGEEFVIVGECKKFCKTYNLVMSQLKRHLGCIVPQPKQNKINSPEWEKVLNTIGWKLEKIK